ncbi:MAG TPA: GTPase, partial [Thermoplasmata archaeon]|nr:GTPase [Thermoplasmata archaeon]
MPEKKKKNVLIMGAAGMDFHLFNVYFKENPDFRVKCFTATQIPFIENRHFPPELAGPLYPEGIPIYPEKVKEGGREVEKVPEYIKKFDIHVVVLAYSDLSHQEVMHRASIANASGADFWLMSNTHAQLKSKKPVISICATRTGCGKSQTTRFIASLLRERGYKVVVVRHPMPYDPDLTSQICQRFERYQDLDKYNTTIEEREEYEPHIDMGVVLYAGVDYKKILEEVEKEADIILWDGGNNDIPFYKTDLHIVVTDPLRAGDEVSYHPGEVNLRAADVVVINKIDTAEIKAIMKVRENIIGYNPKAKIVETASPVVVDDFEKIKGKKVLVVEDGPTLTHGGMKFGA